MRAYLRAVQTTLSCNLLVVTLAALPAADKNAGRGLCRTFCHLRECFHFPVAQSEIDAKTGGRKGKSNKRLPVP